MNMKEPNTTLGEWVIAPEGPLKREHNHYVHRIIANSNECVYHLAEGESEEKCIANAKLIAACKKMAGALESIAAIALRYMDDPKRQTGALWDIEEAAYDALITAGYTEGEEDDT
jgi:hypothetical protein